jgi:PAS domain S-box-containing protein
MRLYFEKHVFIGFSLAIVILIFLGWYSFSSLQRLIQTASLLSKASRVINNADQVMKSIIDLETGQRGYVITGNKDFLEPFEKAQLILPKQLNTLDSVTLDNQQQHQRVQRLKKLFDSQIAWTVAVIEAREVNFEKSSALINSGIGKRGTDSIRALVNEIQSEERKTFRATNTVTSKTLKQFQFSFSGLILTATLVVIYLIYTINSSLQARKRIEKELQDAVDESRNLYDTSPCGYFTVNEKLVFTNINATMLKWLGYVKEEVVTKMIFFDFLSDPCRTEFLKTFEVDFEQYKRDGFVNDLELEFKRKDDSVFSVILNSVLLFNSKAEFTGSHTTVFDNTERKRTQEKFKGLLEAAPDASVIVDEEGVIQMANNHCSVVFGYTREELIGQKVELLMPTRYHHSHPNHRKHFFSNPSVRPMGIGLQLWGARKNGEEFPIEISLSPIETSEGLLVSTSIRDVTERKKTENTILKLNKELESFTYSVSHDLRAPLRSVAGYTQILSEDYSDKLDDEGQRIIQIIIKNAKRMGQLIDDLLNFSRLGRKEIVRGKVNMDELVRDIIMDMQATPGVKEINFNISSLVPANADVSMLRQVWVNLLSNSIKYSSKKESIKIEVASYSTLNQYCYYVRDNGAGFDMQYANKLFGVFQRLHKMNEFEGTGVGLALVKTIVDRHGGSVWAEGVLGEGATFYFSLPKTN